jgi:hypothetical protein
VTLAPPPVPPPAQPLHHPCAPPPPLYPPRAVYSPRPNGGSVLRLTAIVQTWISAWQCGPDYFQRLPSAHVPNQGVIKRDWVATGRIDFATQLTTNPGDDDRPTEFKLLVEERRIVESIAGNENLEIQWRLATLREAKSVVTQYHKYLSDNSLIKTVFDETASLPPPVTTQGNPSD